MNSVVRNLFKNAPAAKQCVVVPKANITNAYHCVVVPGRNQLPFAKRVVLGGMIFCSIIAIPAWVLLHINEYNGKPYKYQQQES